MALSGIFGQTDVILDNLAKAKGLSDPVQRDTQVIWHYNFLIESLASQLDPRALLYLDTLYTITKKSTWPSAMAFYHRARGKYHDTRGEFTKALEHYSDAVLLYDKAGGVLKERAYSYVLKGFLLSNSNLHDECRQVFDIALPIAKMAEGKNSLSLILDWYGDCFYYGLGREINLDSALYYYLRVNEILPSISYAPIKADNYSVLSGIYYRKGDQIKAETYYAQAEEIALSQGLWHVFLELLGHKSTYLTANGDHHAANQLLRQAEGYVKNSKNIEFLARLESLLYNNYKKLGQMDSALVHLENNVEMENTMRTDDVGKKYQELLTKYNVAEQEIKIAKLENDKRQTIWYFLLLISVGLAFGAYFLIRRNKQLADSLKLLEKTKREAQNAYLLGEQIERKRLSADLHDSVNTKLAAAKWQLDYVSNGLNDRTKKSIDDTAKLLDTIYSDVRRISHHLLPEELENTGLFEVIEALIHKLNRTTQIQFALHRNNVATSEIEDLKYVLYNVIFQLVNNILSHSEATRASILFDKKDKSLHITISDNGHGYDPEKQIAGVGLKNIHARIAAVSGLIRITSNAQGTSSHFTIPLSKN